MKRLTLFLLLMILSLIAKPQNPEIWGTFKVTGSINNRFKIVVEVEERYNFIEHNIRYTHYDIGTTYKLNNHFIIGAFYREIYAYKNEEYFRANVSHLDIFYRSGHFKLRTRGEYIASNGNGNYIRLRIRPGWQFDLWNNFNPFMQNEIFLLDLPELTRNRLNMGITIKFKKVVFQPGYMLESNHKTEWSHRNIFWINTKFKF